MVWNNYYNPGFALNLFQPPYAYYGNIPRPPVGFVPLKFNLPPNIAAPMASAVPNIAAPMASAFPNIAAPMASAVPNIAAPMASAVPNIAVPMASAVPNIAAPMASAVPNIATPMASAVPNIATPMASATPNMVINHSIGAPPNLKPPSASSTPIHFNDVTNYPEYNYTQWLVNSPVMTNWNAITSVRQGNPTQSMEPSYNFNHQVSSDDKVKPMDYFEDATSFNALIEDMREYPPKLYPPDKDRWGDHFLAREAIDEALEATPLPLEMTREERYRWFHAANPDMESTHFFVPDL